MQNAWSYIKDYGGLLKKIRNVDNIPENSILVTSDVVRLYPNILHNAGLKALKKLNQENISLFLLKIWTKS